MGIWYVSSLPLFGTKNGWKGSKLQATIYEWEIIVIKCALGLMRRRVKQKQFSQDLHLDDYFWFSNIISVTSFCLKQETSTRNESEAHSKARSKQRRTFIGI